MTAIALRLLLTYWRQLLIGLAVVGALWWAYSAVWHRGYDAADRKWNKAQEAAAAKAAADTKLLQDAITAIDEGITIDMEAISNVRTVYRDKIQFKAVDIYRNRPECRLTDELRNDINKYATELARTSGLGVSPLPADAVAPRQ